MRSSQWWNLKSESLSPSSWVRLKETRSLSSLYERWHDPPRVCLNENIGKTQIVQSIDGMGDSDDFLLNKVGEGGSNNWFQQSRSPNCQYWGLFSRSLLNLLTQHGFWREYPTHQELILLISIYFPQCGSLKTLGNQYLMTFSPSRRYSNRCRVQGNLRPWFDSIFWLKFVR